MPTGAGVEGPVDANVRGHLLPTIKTQGQDAVLSLNCPSPFCRRVGGERRPRVGTRGRVAPCGRGGDVEAWASGCGATAAASAGSLASSALTADDGACPC